MRNVYIFVTLLVSFALSTSPSLAQCWKMVSPGMNHTVAVKSDNTLWAWGFNASGQLGDNTVVEKQVPVQIALASNWKTVSAGGNHTLAIKTDGSLWAWGDNFWGQIGDGSFGNIRRTPVAIGTAKDWVAISAGESFSVALKSDGTLWAWGDNFYGQLGHGSVAYAPKKVGTATNWKYISAGGSHVVAVKTDNTLWGWGLNLDGQLGDGTQTNRSAPVRIGIASNWQTVEAGYDHTVALTSNGTLWTWGSNESGELGNGATAASSTPLQVGTSLWKSVAAGKDNSLAIQNDGTLWTWGIIIGGVVLGEDTYRTSPAQLITTTTVESIALGDNHAIAFATNGPVLTWGIGTWGKLGDDSWMDRNQPTVLFTPPPVGPGAQLICQGIATLASLTATGTSVLWYDAPVGGTQLPTATPVVDGGHYYASQTKYGCVSQTRLKVTVTIRTAPAAPSGQPGYTFCNGEKLSAISITGSSIKWYSASTGGTLLNPTLVTLTDKVRYYASQTIDGCESLQRYEVVANRNNTAAPTAPTLTQTFCGSSTIADIALNGGTNIKWYADATSTTALPVSTPVVSGSSYYATSTVGGLESCTRLKITTLITNATPPTAASRQPFCNTGRVALLKATGTGSILWYKVPSGGTLLSGSETLVSGMYYASQKIGACESADRFAVEVFINKAATPPPTGDANQVLCDDALITDLVVAGQNKKWYFTATGGSEMSGMALEAPYYATQTIDACESTTRLKVTVTTNRAALPVFPTAMPFRARLIEAGVYSSFAIMDDGTLWSWGGNLAGLLGNGSTNNVHAPTMISAETDWISLKAGNAHALALKSNGTLWAWGANDAGQLGVSATTSGYFIPTQIGTDSDWKMIAAGGGHTLALKTNGTLWSCGYNYAGQTGIDTDRGWPLYGLHQVGTASDWKTIAAGGWQSIALKNDGSMWVWGKIGRGTNDGTTVQVKIPSNNPWRFIASGTDHVLGIQTDGSLWGFGSNEYSQLGDGTDFNSQTEPSRVGSDNDWLEAGGGSAHSIAIKSDGTLWGWGQPWYGQVGVEPPPSSFKTPTRVGGDADWKSLSGGFEHNLGMRSDGSIWSWGRNISGELGEGTTLTGFTPKPVQKSDLYTCGNGVLLDVISDASQLNWYATAGTTTSLDPLTPIVSGNQYFVSQTANGKESCYRKAVTITTTQTLPPAPAGNAVQMLCAGSKIADLEITGTAIRWYDAPVGGALLTPSTILINGRHYYAAQRSEGCESATRLDVTVNLNVINAPSVQSTQVFCEGATVGQLAATGTAIRWYLTVSDATPLDYKTQLINNKAYFASQKIGSCESSRLATTTTVNPLTPAPGGNASQIFCQASTVADLQANGTNLVWYELQTDGAPLASSTALVNEKHYFATQAVNGCVSPARLEVRATITILNTPSANLTQNFCEGATVTNLSTGATNPKWYLALTGGSALSSTTLLQSRKYYVSQTSGPCESSRLGVSVNVGPIPTPPDGTTSQTFCKSGTVANLSATGTNIKWFDVPNGGTALVTTTSLVNGKHYYSSQQPAGAYCVSDRRLDVTVTVTTTPLPDAAIIQEFCNSSTVGDLKATGTDVKWYAALTGGSVLSATTALIDNQPYFVSQTVGMCESDRRTVTVKIKALPQAPTGSGWQAFCSSGTMADLNVTGENVQWYSTPSGGTALPTLAALANDSKYYASQSINGCTSANRLEVTVNLITPATPQAENIQTFCEGASITAFDVSGTNLVWYAIADGGSSISSATVLQDGQQYFVAEQLDVCESSRKQITAEVNDIPPAPTGEPIQAMKENKTIADLLADGDNLTWYPSERDAINRTNSLKSSHILTNDAFYYATQKRSGCESDEILEVRVNTIMGTEHANYKLICQPNPVKDYLNISLDRVIQQITLQNSVGQTVLTKELNSTQGVIDFSAMPSGVFILRIDVGNQELSMKIVKQ